jgi:hypothetical protein
VTYHQLFPRQSSVLEENDLPDETPQTDEAFCLSDFPRELYSEDPINQEELIQNLQIDPNPADQFRRQFEAMEIKRIKLSDLRRRYDEKLSTYAINCLRDRTQIVLDNDSIYPVDSPEIVLQCQDHFLDFFMVVSSTVGLDAVLPNKPVDHTWAFTMDLTQHFRQWRTNYGRLGFDSAGRMLYVGKRLQEDVWIALAPLAFVQNTLAEEPAGIQTGPSSCLTPIHFRSLAMFLNCCLKEMAYSDLTMNKEYPDVSTAAKAKQDSNIL